MQDLLYDAALVSY